MWFKLRCIWQNVLFVFRTAIREVRYLASPAYRLRVESKTGAMRDGAPPVSPEVRFHVRELGPFPTGNLGGLFGARGILGGQFQADLAMQARIQAAQMQAQLENQQRKYDSVSLKLIADAQAQMRAQQMIDLKQRGLL